MYFERTIRHVVERVNATFPVLLLTGPRQVGKSTLLERMAGTERKIVSLDNPTIRLLAQSDPELFLQRYTPPVLIDEVQYAPQLFPYIKILVDTRKQSGDFWLTGSQMFPMMKLAGESLAGRVGIIKMLGLTSSEMDGQERPAFLPEPEEMLKQLPGARPQTVSEVFERIYRGSMPRLYELNEVDQDFYYESYLETYLSRDVRELGQVGNLASFTNFLRVVAARTATTVNYAAMAQEVGVSAPTIKSWLSLLVSCGLVLLVEPYANNMLKRMVRSPRMYLTDTGLAVHLMGWDSARVLETGAMSGQFFETWVVTEIYKSWLNAGKTPRLFFYRDAAGKEIDLLLEDNDTLYPMEIKKGSAPRDAVKNFGVLKSLEENGARIGTGSVICMSSELMPMDRRNWYVPCWMI